MRIIVMVTILFAYSSAMPARSRLEHYNASTPMLPPSVLHNLVDVTNPLVAQTAVSNRCVTPHLSCLLAESVPVGTACWCATPNGPVTGTVK